MVGKKKLFNIFLALFLVSLVFGMPPLNLAHNLASGCLFAKSKPISKGGPSFRYSLPSPNNMDAVISSSFEPGNQIVQLRDLAPLNLIIPPSDSLLKPIPMRC